MNSAKVYVPVKAVFTDDGSIRPVAIAWEDGSVYTVDKVKEVRPAAAMKAGGQGDRYTVVINGRESYLFFERNNSITGNNLGRWFVERRNP